MVTHMKTTVDINDHLLESAKRRAHEEKRTLKDLMEEGLRRVLNEDRGKKAFKLRKVPPFTGEMLPEAREGGWETIRDIIYGLR